MRNMASFLKINLDEQMAGARAEVNTEKSASRLTLHYGKKPEGAYYAMESPGEWATRMAYRMLCHEHEILRRRI